MGYKKKECKMCGDVYQPNSGQQLFCDSCKQKNISEYNKQYNKLYGKERYKKKKDLRKKYRNEHKEEAKKYKKEYYKELREQVIDLYSNGEKACQTCSGEVSDLHHLNKEDGIWERENIGRGDNTKARQHQLLMFAIRPNYIIPLCKKCHIKIHKKYRLMEASSGK